jgi:hypothetical protein
MCFPHGSNDINDYVFWHVANVVKFFTSTSTKRCPSYYPNFANKNDAPFKYIFSHIGKEVGTKTTHYRESYWKIWINYMKR